MSHSPNDPQDQQGELPRTFAALSKMLREGRNFSGHERNCCFLNTLSSPAAQGRFANISAVSGLDFPDDGRAVAQVDWDHDGDLDLWISNRNAPRLRFLRNDVQGKGHFLSLRLVGNGGNTNRDGIGARVEVMARRSQSENSPPSALVKTLRAGEGFLAQSSKWLHFGLGQATIIDKVIVRWPSSNEEVQFEEFNPPKIDCHYELVQGTGKVREVTSRALQLKLAPSDPPLPPPTAKLRMPMLVRLPAPRVSYRNFDGAPIRLPIDTGKNLLVNLWSSSCRPCLEELTELSKRVSDLRNAGIEVVALSVDGLGNDQFDSDRTRKLLAELAFPFSAGRATPGLISYFRRLLEYQTPIDHELPLPTSFLIDKQGRLAIVYKGPLSTDVLLEDVQFQAESPEERFEYAAALPGRAIRHPVVRQTMKLRETQIRFLLANELRRAGRLDEAIVQYNDVLGLDPDLTRAHHYLGLVYRTQGKLDQARASYERALRIDPDAAEVNNDLGVLLFKKGHFDQAKACYERAIGVKPQYVEAVMNLGMLLEKQGRLAQATSHYARALRINPQFSPAELHLGLVAERQGKLVEASTHYARALRLDADNVDAHNNLGVVSAKLGKMAQARSHFEQALRINPRLAEAHNNLGLLDEIDGKFARAATHYEEAVRIDPGYTDAKTNLAHVRGLLREQQSPSH